jgi:hypothetical protein
MSVKPGYIPVVQSSAAQQLSADPKSLDRSTESLVANFKQFRGTRVTRRELTRDFGFTETGLRLLKQAGLLVPEAPAGGWPTYNLEYALRLRVYFWGFAAAPTTRVRRKRQRVSTVLKNVIEKMAVGSRGEQETS